MFLYTTSALSYTYKCMNGDIILELITNQLQHFWNVILLIVLISVNSGFTIKMSFFKSVFLM